MLRTRTVPLLLVSMVVTLASVGCSGRSTAGSGKCECEAGFLCGEDDLCHEVCNSKSHCAACEDCVSGLCLPMENCAPLTGHMGGGVCAAGGLVKSDTAQGRVCLGPLAGSGHVATSGDMRWQPGPVFVIEAAPAAQR